MAKISKTKNLSGHLKSGHTWTLKIRPYVDTENPANAREAFSGLCRMPSHRNSPGRAKAAILARKR